MGQGGDGAVAAMKTSFALLLSAIYASRTPARGSLYLILLLLVAQLIFMLVFVEESIAKEMETEKGNVWKQLWLQ